MLIMGIDPGIGITGYSFVEYNNESFELITSGSIQTDKTAPHPKRLKELKDDMDFLIKKYQPDCASIEQLFFFKNQKTVIPVAEARGVILTVLEKFNIPTFGYTPMVVKQVLTGYGRADKKEVEQMVRIALESENLPKLDDTVDAIAIAICHSRSLR